MNNNIEWVTYLKVFGILSVILGHINSPLGGLIYSWHMPLFFILSGFFIKTEGNIKFLIIKDWKRLMLPYFIFVILALAITMFKRWGLNREPLNYVDELNAIFFWMNYKHLINSYGFVLWFLPALFFSKFFYYLIMKNISSLLIQFCLCIILFLMSFQLQLPFAFSNAMNSVIWLFIGSQSFRVLNCYSIFECRRYFPVFILLVPLVLVVSIYAYSGIPKLDMSLLIYEHYIINVLWAASFFLLLALFCKTLAGKAGKSRFVEQWGAGSMILFILHPYTNNISHILVEILNFGSWPLKLLISLALLQLILMMKERYSNWWFFKYV